jgi:hypothetical protein
LTQRPEMALKGGLVGSPLSGSKGKKSEIRSE